MKVIKIITLSFVILVTILMNNSCSNSKKTISNMECTECELEPDPGPCKAAFPRFYFDRTDKKCKEFIWGGCNGLVPFETLEACVICNCM